MKRLLTLKKVIPFLLILLLLFFACQPDDPSGGGDDDDDDTYYTISGNIKLYGSDYLADAVVYLTGAITSQTTTDSLQVIILLKILEMVIIL